MVCFYFNSLLSFSASAYITVALKPDIRLVLYTAGKISSVVLHIIIDIPNTVFLVLVWSVFRPWVDEK